MQSTVDKITKSMSLTIAHVLWRFEDGTLPFLEIVAIKHGFEPLDIVAGKQFLLLSRKTWNIVSAIKNIMTCRPFRTLNLGTAILNLAIEVEMIWVKSPYWVNTRVQRYPRNASVTELDLCPGFTHFRDDRARITVGELLYKVQI